MPSNGKATCCYLKDLEALVLDGSSGLAMFKVTKKTSNQKMKKKMTVKAHMFIKERELQTTQGNLQQNSGRT